MKQRPLTEQQKWMLEQIGDDPDRFIAIRLNASWLFCPSTGYDFLLVETWKGGNLICPREATRLLRRGLYQTLFSLVRRGLLASVGHVDGYGELYTTTAQL